MSQRLSGFSIIWNHYFKDKALPHLLLFSRWMVLLSALHVQSSPFHICFVLQHSSKENIARIKLQCEVFSCNNTTLTILTWWKTQPEQTDSRGPLVLRYPVMPHSYFKCFISLFHFLDFVNHITCFCKTPIKQKLCSNGSVVAKKKSYFQQENISYLLFLKRTSFGFHLCYCWTYVAWQNSGGTSIPTDYFELESPLAVSDSLPVCPKWKTAVRNISQKG